MPDKDKKEEMEKLKILRREIKEKLEEQLPESPLAPIVREEILNPGEVLEPEKTKQVIEALLFAATKPLTPQEIRKVLRFMTPSEIVKVIEEIRLEFQGPGRSFELIEVAGGYEFASKKDYAPWILKIELQKKQRQVTISALETLAILVYKQPITRAEVEDLRGVDASGVMSTLMERGFVKIVGRKEVPGRPFLYGTTDKFLEHFGLRSLQDLPNIEEIKGLVENSVRRDELLSTPKIVEVESASATSVAPENQPEANPVEQEINGSDTNP